MEPSFLMSESDFVVLGLVINLTNLNELEHRTNSGWKSKMIGISALQIAVYSGLLTISLFTEVVNQVIINETSLFIASVSIAAVSLLHGWVVIDRLNKLNKS